LGKFSDKGWSDRTSRKAVWAQGWSLSAAPQVVNLTKVATATSEAGKKTFGTFGLFQKYVPSPNGDEPLQSGDSHTEADKSVLPTFTLFKDLLPHFFRLPCSMSGMLRFASLRRTYPAHAHR
jgi:hypothetical protein